MDQIIQCSKKKTGVQEPHEIYVIHIGMALKSAFLFAGVLQKMRQKVSFVKVLQRF